MQDPHARSLAAGCGSCAAACRVSGLKGVAVVTAAAANRHTVVAASDGRVFSWGSNLQGQLGYGTSDSASNATPRLVEAMKVRSQGFRIQGLGS